MEENSEEGLVLPDSTGVNEQHLHLPSPYHFLAGRRKKAERTFRKRIPTFSFSSIREEFEDVKTADEISLALMGG